MAGQPILGFEDLVLPLRVVRPKPRSSRHVWYVPNHRSFGAFIRSDQMRDVTADVAEDIAKSAAALTPVGEDGDGKHLRDQFKVVKNAGVMKVGGNIRVKVEVVNNARHAAIVEFGSSKSTGPRGRRMLLRAGARFGDVKIGGGGGA